MAQNAIACFALTLIWTTAASAESTFGSFPTLDRSARATALGGGLVALTDDAEANTANPAGLLHLGTREISVTYANLYGLDLVDQTVAQFAWPILEKSYEIEEGKVVQETLAPPAKRAFGLSISNLSADALGGLSYRETEIGLNLAWRTPGNTFVGGGIRFLFAQSEGGGDDLEVPLPEASGQAVQVGLQRDVADFRFGVVIQDFLSSVDWNEGQDDALPARFSIGLAWLPSHLPLRGTGEFAVRGAQGNSRLGGALEWDAVGPLTLRAGLRSAQDPLESNLEWSGGLGVDWSGLEIDYGVLENGNDLGMTHRWSASIGL